MTEAKTISSPMASSCKLSKSGNNILSDPTMYRSVVGKLQYATITWPELSFSVNKVCQFMANPLETHWTAVKSILHFLKGTIHHGLLLFPDPSNHPLIPYAYVPSVMLTGLPTQMTGGLYQVQLSWPQLNFLASQTAGCCSLKLWSWISQPSTDNSRHFVDSNSPYRTWGHFLLTVDFLWQPRYRFSSTQSSASCLHKAHGDWR